MNRAEAQSFLTASCSTIRKCDVSWKAGVTTSARTATPNPNPHLWEKHGPETFQRLRGQFAAAVWDSSTGELFLAQNSFGICPLYWTRQTSGDTDWLLFASEIKGLLASGMVPARPDLRGLDQVFTFFGMPGPRTAFAGIQSLLPGSSANSRAACS